jgi:hypothetical protein
MCLGSICHRDSPGTWPHQYLLCSRLGRTFSLSECLGGSSGLQNSALAQRWCFLTRRNSQLCTDHPWQTLPVSSNTLPGCTGGTQLRNMHLRRACTVLGCTRQETRSALHSSSQLGKCHHHSERFNSDFVSPRPKHRLVWLKEHHPSSNNLSGIAR